MRSGPAPLRFLGLVLGGWIGVRAIVLVPDWANEPPIVEALPLVAAVPSGRTERIAPDVSVSALAQLRAPVSGLRLPRGSGEPSVHRAGFQRTGNGTLGPREHRQLSADQTRALTSMVPGVAQIAPQLVPAQAPGRLTVIPSPVSASVSRWSLSTWAFVRRGGDEPLAAGGQLGGSQIGARALYRLDDRLAISARLYSPLNTSKGAEVALGAEVQPLRDVPVRLVAERRQAIGREGRSAFALLAHGGVSGRRVAGPVLIDAYAQAGLVGLKSRDGFVDGSLRLNLPVTEQLSVGGGAWGAAQPGVSRLDLGPQASYRLPVGNGMRISAEWRVRVAGDARPGSGPALTLASDF